jgi:hypothetical protein
MKGERVVRVVRRVDLRALVSNERGATALFLAAGMSVFLSATAIAVDLGMLANSRTEAQRVADAAALAGASSLVFLPGNEQNARQWAKDYASRNTVRGQPISLRDQDIDIVGDTVRVRVLRTESHGGQVPTTFARVMGIGGVDISAVAAAEASSQVAAVGCLLPLTVADRWVNFGSPEWDPSEGDYYEPPYRPDGSPNGNYVGYDEIGELFTLSPSQGGKGKAPGLPESSRVMPSVYNLWLPRGVNGTPELRIRIMGCPDDDPLGNGDPMWREPGNVQTLVDEFRDILADPEYSGQYYDDGCKCVRDANSGHEVVTGGLRLRVVPVHDISTFVKQGSGPHFAVSHFMGVFIDSVDPGPKGTANVYARVMPAFGLPGAGAPAGPLVRAVRLVQ